MVSKAEQGASRCLRSVVAPLADGERIADSKDFEDLQIALEVFVSVLLCEVYPREWRHESLDGFRFSVARKTGPREAELFGLCLLISDQAWTPFHARIRASSTSDVIEWVFCRLGDGGAAGRKMTRLPYGSAKVSKWLFSLTNHPEDIDWAFAVER